MKTILVAAGLLEIESLIMNARAQVLQHNQPRFTELMLEARVKLGELTAALFGDGCAGVTELFLASQAQGASPDAVSAIDPADGTGQEGATRDSDSSSSTNSPGRASPRGTA